MAKESELKREAKAEGETVAEEKMEQMRRPRRARGGAAPAKEKVQVYNAQGSAEERAAKDEDEEFKRGGHAKRKAGGLAEGGAARERGDRSPRGRHERHAAGGRAGGSPFSSGRTMDMPKDNSEGRGKEGMKVPEEPFV